MKVFARGPLFLWLALFTLPAWAPPSPNGRFGGPSWESYLELTRDERLAYQRAAGRLRDPAFVFQENFFSADSFYAARGTEELRAVALRLMAAASGVGRVVSIGRSGTGLLFYLRGWWHHEGGGPRLTDLPFSWSTSERMTDGQRRALRAHLSRNRLTPRLIARAAEPILFFDFLYSGRGALTVLEEISLWAKEEGLEKECREKMHFAGLFAPRMIVRENLRRIRQATMKEMGGGWDVSPFPTEEEVDDEARRCSMPMEAAFERACSRVTPIRISDAFYIYAGHRAHHANESFTRERWEGPVDRTEPVSFVGNHEHPALVELFWLAELGQADALARVGCAGPIGNQAAPRSDIEADEPAVRASAG